MSLFYIDETPSDESAATAPRLTRKERRALREANKGIKRGENNQDGDTGKERKNKTKAQIPEEAELDPLDPLTPYILQYQNFFLPLIEEEKRFEVEQFENRLKRWSLDRLVNEGYTLLNLSARPVVGQWGKVLIEFTAPYYYTGRFSTGDQVRLSIEDPLKETPNIEGVVTGKTNRTITVAFDIRVDISKVWRMDQSISLLSYNRMVNAVKAIGKKVSAYNSTGPINQDLSENIEDEDSHSFRGSSLRDIFIGATKCDPNVPSGLFANNQNVLDWCKKQLERPPEDMTEDEILTQLNGPQLKAVATMLRNRFSLIQGPPGTGKTWTIVNAISLLKRHFKINVPILVSGFTNMAVDNLLDGLNRCGISALRVGQSLRVREDLRTRTVDYHFETHPQSKEYEEIRELLRAMNASKPVAGVHTTKDFSQYYKERGKLTQKLSKLHGKIYRDILQADIICTTCVSAASGLLRAIDFPLVIIDEGSLSTEPGTLIPLMKGARHACILGDHQQLPPTILNTSNAALAYSLFERFYDQGAAPSTMLTVQYRMHPNIAFFSSQMFYKGLVQSAPSVFGRKSIQFSLFRDPLEYPIVFLDHSYPERSNGTSYDNDGEAQIAFNALLALFQENPDLAGDAVGIITPYIGQVNCLTRYQTSYISSERQSSTYGNAYGYAGGYTNNHDRSFAMSPLSQKITMVEINSVDSFQGREKDVIIYSGVRCNGRGSIGFLGDVRRMNVALTRARLGFIMVGSASTVESGLLFDSQVSRDHQSDQKILSGWSEYMKWIRDHDLLRPSPW
ncbi:P-loop containing nucleoside triphosphate hydrolase protein [Lipomyces tetrasporus]|uniref:P-loop containing nucleoside triphosphate hydrolase protein n=1 Tax=Lipomyces tetrasporus TaxID=54092 RepID=A0AAD7QT24_9ASCO|nr:P-loop containing nucleoside triphosphate hydrolase protein [Lipomyces tetrasporus]KAJ8100476.1 P-loop containing nucleoside triphosphate hydrolase protein [Lipomyces tetrasporus]